MSSVRKPFDGRRTVTRFAALVLIYLAVVDLLPRPEAVSPEGWRLTGIFVATVAGLVLEPIAGGGVVLLAVVAAVFLAGFTPAQALSGYADPSVWLVMAAFFISRGLLKTGLARRVALVFVRAFGKTSVGVCYALGLSDMVLASIIPSNSARSGGVTLPITRAIAELYGSQPGPTARKLGAFLMVGVYQCAVVSAATFLTGQASNPLAARMAGDFGHPVTWSSWALASIVPGLLSMAIVPLIVYRIHRPEISRTPEAAAFAASELETMGRMGRQERILAVIFALVCGTWATSGLHGLDITVTALCGGLALLVTGVLTWDDILSEKPAWDIFVWYGGVMMLGRALNDTGVATVFAESFGQLFSGLAWLPLLLVALVIYFFAHYAFASITTHILAMYPAFVAVLLAKDAPVGLVVLAFAFFANLSAGLTHYGTAPAPMYYEQGYLPMKDWWRVGAVVGVANLVIWGTAGFLWWKVLGLW
ncbi:MAG TPA: DASS family sodium-coupled anion symporter [Longimicrobiales bacterium]|nr:DASS family sodium-coupled anion symporter [Longimicrobiales bacterium]